MTRTAERTRIVGCAGPASLSEAHAMAACARDVEVVELRLDALRESADPAALRAAFEGKTLVATLRSTAEGGAFRGPAGSAKGVLSAALEAGFDLADVEYRAGEGADLLGLPPSKVILSVHDRQGLPPDLPALTARMAATGARYVKIAGTANDSSDAIRVLEAQASMAGGNVTLLAMGDAGIATRVLGPYLGAPLAYAALLAGRGTAPGQLSAVDLSEVYGIGRPRRASRLFALLGGRVSHSLSPAIHNASFEAKGMDALYVPIALRSLLRELPALRDGLSRLGLPLAGASVTIPFKGEAAEVAGMGEPVNTLLFPNGGGISAANTDREGLERLIPPAKKGERALVLGAGGLGKVAIGVLLQRGFQVFLYSQPEEQGREVAALLGVTFLSKDLSSASARLVVNATPLGLAAGDPLPIDAALLAPGMLVVDAPYREGGTELVHAARAAGADVMDGFALLLAQAAGQATLFAGRPVSAGDLAGGLPKRLRGHFAPGAAHATGASR